MTPPTFDHAPECTSRFATHEGKPVCSCGATDRKAAYEAGWNAAVEAGLVALDTADGAEPPESIPHALYDVFDAGADAVWTIAGDAIRKLKKNA